MEQVKRTVEKLLCELIRHGQGKMTINIGPYSTDKTSILIEAGRAYRFITDRFNKIDD